jgi:hypothetical protein
MTGPTDGKVTAITVDDGLVKPGAPAVIDLATKPAA